MVAYITYCVTHRESRLLLVVWSHPIPASSRSGMFGTMLSCSITQKPMKSGLVVDLKHSELWRTF